MPKLNMAVLAGGAGMTLEAANEIAATFSTEQLAVIKPSILSSKWNLPKETAEWLTLLAAWVNKCVKEAVPREPETLEEWTEWAKNLEGDSDNVEAARYWAKKLKEAQDQKRCQQIIDELKDLYQELSVRIRVSPATVTALGPRSVAIGGNVEPGTTIITGRP